MPHAVAGIMGHVPLFTTTCGFLQTYLLPSHKTSSTVTAHEVILDDTSGLVWDVYVHVQVHTSSTFTSHEVILDNTSGLRVGGVRWGWDVNVHVHVHTLSTSKSHCDMKLS